jgi:hypothetical protein
MCEAFYDQRNKRWTMEEATALKDGFTNGKRLKLLAQEIGRSETAVNKFLSRSGIRGKCRGTYKRQFWIEDKQKKYELTNEISHKVYKNEIQSDFSDVLEYMRSRGHKISRTLTKQYKFFKISADFIMDGRPISSMKLLMQANKLRVEEKKPIFSIPSVFW